MPSKQEALKQLNQVVKYGASSILCIPLERGQVSLIVTDEKRHALSVIKPWKMQPVSDMPLQSTPGVDHADVAVCSDALGVKCGPQQQQNRHSVQNVLGPVHGLLDIMDKNMPSRCTGRGLHNVHHSKQATFNAALCRQSWSLTLQRLQARSHCRAVATISFGTSLFQSVSAAKSSVSMPGGGQISARSLMSHAKPMIHANDIS